ncbi:MAG: PDZ domain-containing protein [Planctomycetes bacterium]|nr:PDZ domain-containing protein [Planctomycetota bacterium]
MSRFASSPRRSLFLVMLGLCVTASGWTPCWAAPSPTDPIDAAEQAAWAAENPGLARAGIVGTEYHPPHQWPKGLAVAGAAAGTTAGVISAFWTLILLAEGPLSMRWLLTTLASWTVAGVSFYGVKKQQDLEQKWSGLRVQQVRPGSRAAQAQIKPGDIITHGFFLGGTDRIVSAKDLDELLLLNRDRTIAIQLWRGDQKLKLPLDLSDSQEEQSGVTQAIEQIER